MKHRNTFAWLLAAAALTLTPPALAQDAAIAIDDGFERADVDGNGCVDWEEMRNMGNIVFGALDLNNDGSIAGDEHPAARNAAGEEVAQLPAVSSAAFQVEVRKAFERADKDGSGCLGADEYEE